jgi:SAM-dependent methyltransferase
MPPDIAGAIGWFCNKVTPGTDFLDFGCSTGYFGSFVKKLGINVYGVEISEDRKKAAEVLDGVYSFDLDGEWPEIIRERQYDYLFFGDVLEHLKDPTLALKKAGKLLKKDGVVFVSIPNIAHSSIRLELLRGDFIYEPMGILDNTHLQYFTLDGFTRRASEAGFDTELVDFTANDIPREIAAVELKRLGLTATDKFWRSLATVEARAYQYKFVLKRTTHNKPGVTQQKELSLKPLQFRDDIISDYKKQIKLLDAHSRKQAKIIDYYIALNQQIKEENSRRLGPIQKVSQMLKGIDKKFGRGHE